MIAFWPSDRARQDTRIAIALGLFVFAVMGLTQDRVGFVRDEGFYFYATEVYSGWFDKLWEYALQGKPGWAAHPVVLKRYWEYNDEHPALLKSLFTLSWMLFHRGLGWLNDAAAARLPGWAFMGLCVALVFRFGALTINRRAGMLAALMLLTHPRMFHHGHLATFDIGITAMTLACVYAYWRGQSNWAWAIGTGVLWGLALETKLNAFFIPVYFVAHWVLTALPKTKILREGRDLRFDLPALPAAWFAMAVLGPLVFAMFWPWLWFDTFKHLGSYFWFHMKHEHYPVAYANTILLMPPFPRAFPYVMTAITVPLATLALVCLGTLRAGVETLGYAVVGLRARFRGGAAADAGASDDFSLNVMLLLCGLIPLYIISQPSTPIFGGVKHWFPGMPFLFLLGARELDSGLQNLWAWWPRSRGASGTTQWATYTLAVGLAALPGLLGIATVHPNGISYYNEAAGGVRGAADMGMMRNFWGYLTRNVTAELAEAAAPDAKVHFHRTNQNSFRWYQKAGLLPGDMRYYGGLAGADFFVFHNYQTWENDRARWFQANPSRAPVKAVYVDEVPIVQLYKRRGYGK